MLEDIATELKNKQIFYRPNILSNIFSWQELEKLINLRPFINSQRVHIISDQEDDWKWPYQNWLTDVNTYPPTLFENLIRKYTVFLSDCSRVNEKINSICGEIENITGCSSDAHLYFNLVGNNSESFGIHCDISNVLVLQVEGTTRFKIWSKFNKNRMVDNLGHIDQPPVVDVEMKPGDVVYIPKYYYHQGISTTKRLSISFPHFESEDLHQDRKWIEL